MKDEMTDEDRKGKVEVKIQRAFCAGGVVTVADKSRRT
jgi:hypothetical protein